MVAQSEEEPIVSGTPHTKTTKETLSAVQRTVSATRLTGIVMVKWFGALLTASAIRHTETTEAIQSAVQRIVSEIQHIETITGTELDVQPIALAIQLADERDKARRLDMHFPGLSIDDDLKNKLNERHDFGMKNLLILTEGIRDFFEDNCFTADMVTRGKPGLF